MAVLLTALAACGGGGDSASPSSSPSPSTGSKAKWTYLVYMAADNTLSEMATFNVEQMKAAQSSADVRVVVQLEQSRQYTANASTNTVRGLVTRGNAQLNSMGRNVNMADKQSLSEFIKWGKQNYPAERYAVVLWSHGGGWKADKTERGALQDVSSGNGVMSVKDIAWALEDAGGVDLLNFDACLMAMYEVAFELRHAAKVMVASEETIPGQGNPYDRVLNRLVANPGQDAPTLASGIVNDYDAFYRAHARDAVTISAIDLSRLDALDAKVKESAALLINSLATERLNIEAARNASPHYLYTSNHDLIAFANELASRSSTPALRTKAAELASAARASVIANKVYVTAGSSIGGSTGLAIFIPAASNTTTNELAGYKALLASNVATSGGKTWNDFVQTLVTGSGASIGQTVTNGAFAYGISWDNPDVDLDLLVNEPQGNWAGPSISPTSSNSFSSADSFDSGKPLETYTANDELERGAYDVFVQYRGCRKGLTTCGATTVTVFRMDPKAGDTQVVQVGTRRMASSPALPTQTTFQGFITAVNSNAYADWLYVSEVTRALAESPKQAGVAFKQGDKFFSTAVDK